ncbi:MAG: DUF2520 domain-containing protein [Succinivibrio dextrinosolvens]|nr:DUF2520 domain-containing protein [Succinivibrio dextrinosolvens]
MRIGFIGAGKVGCSLALYFHSHHCDISGFFSRTSEHAAQIAKRISSKAYADINELAAQSDLLFLTVPDDEISSVYKRISNKFLKDTTVCHCSGSLTAKEVFGEDDETNGLHKISLHPLCAVDSVDGYRDFDKVYFFMEGNLKTTENIKKFLTDIGLKVRIINSDIKVKYHLAASVVSNQVVALVNEGVEILGQCGFSREESLKALSPLILGNVEHILEKGPVQALTGPVQRGDVNTLNRHMLSLDSYSDRLLYTLLSRKLLKIAKIKNPNRDFSKLEKFVNE